jgi:membrane protein DedA with SNARE-associated domain
VGVILAGTVGSYVGSMIVCALSRWLGRPLVMRYGKYVASRRDQRAGATSLRARRRLLRPPAPVVRHPVSIPAGIVRIPIGRYSLATIAGSALWCAVLLVRPGSAGLEAASSSTTDALVN